MSVQKCNESQVEVFDVWVQLHALSVSWWELSGVIDIYRLFGDNYLL